jgi:hypothetical protein
MTPHSIIIKNADGLPFNNLVYSELHTPPSEIVPLDCTLVFIDTTTNDFELVYAMLVEDPNHIASEYLPFSRGGIKYDFSTKKFLFTKIPVIPLIDLVRAERDRLLTQTDIYMVVPDYPESLQQAVTNYRSALRDLPSNLDPTWTKFSDVTWPEYPIHL